MRKVLEIVHEVEEVLGLKEKKVIGTIAIEDIDDVLAEIEQVTTKRQKIIQKMREETEPKRPKRD